MTMTTTILIPARGGSNRVPRKGLQKVGGKTLIARAVDTAREAMNGYERVLLLFASDDVEMLAEAAVHGANCIKPPASITAEPNGVPDVCKYIREAFPRDSERLCVVLQPTSPFVAAEDLIAVIRTMRKREHTGIESVVSVTVDGKGYRRNGAIYATLGKHWLDGQCVAGPTIFHVMPAERSLDINTLEDLYEAQRMAGGEPELLYAGAPPWCQVADNCGRDSTCYVRDLESDARRPSCTPHALGWNLISRLDGE